MKFDIITLFPEMFSAIKEEGVISRALKNSIISIREWQLRDLVVTNTKMSMINHMVEVQGWSCRLNQ